MRYDLPFFVFRGRSSLEFGLYIVSKDSFHGAARDVTVTSIPGRSGDLILDNGRYTNLTLPYQLALVNRTGRRFDTLAREIRSWLLPEGNYYPLWDTYDGGYFRLASYTGETAIEQDLRDTGMLSVSFLCKPYKYAVDGQKPVLFTEAGRLYNAEAFPAAPYIKITGSGTVTLRINDSAFLIDSVEEYIELDFSMPNAYKGTESKNHLVSGADMSAFRLSPGFNTVSWVGSVEKVEITPRWCCL